MKQLSIQTNSKTYDVLVGNNLLTSANEVIGEITNPFIGVFSTYGLIKAISD